MFGRNNFMKRGQTHVSAARIQFEYVKYGQRTDASLRICIIRLRQPMNVLIGVFTTTRRSTRLRAADGSFLLETLDEDIRCGNRQTLGYIGSEIHATLSCIA